MRLELEAIKRQGMCYDTALLPAGILLVKTKES